MVKPDWSVFRAKFSENPQTYFEWFCYILFCKEFNRPNGIFRYVNQWRLETDPVEHAGEVVGWQSKFYDDTLSKHKIEILRVVRNCKTEYPQITRIIYYSNQDWGQGVKGAPPKGKTEIEKEASENGFAIEWRTSSYFESPSVAQDNASVARHFFSLDNDVVRLIKEKQNHTNTILEEIGTTIEFNGAQIEIDRSETIEKLSNGTSAINIICGDGGVGKTAVVKKLYQQKNSKEKFFYLFRGIEFNTHDINTLFVRCSLYEFVEFHNNGVENIAIIDSAEKLLEIDNQDPFKEFVVTLLKNNWKILFTTRKHYLDSLLFFIIDGIRKAANVEHINELSSSDLEKLSTEYSFNLPHDEKVKDLIRIPFYLQEYLKHYSPEETIDYTGFKQKLWNLTISRNNPERERIFVNIAHDRACSGKFYINPDFSSELLTQFHNEGILGFEIAGYFITHDIFEEWAIERYIERQFINRKSLSQFFTDLGESLPLRRSLRKWLLDKLFSDKRMASDIVLGTIRNETISSFWKDEIVISILLTEYSSEFFTLLSDNLLENDCELLKRIAFLLRLSAKEIDTRPLTRLVQESSKNDRFIYEPTIPKGSGWPAFIGYTFNNINVIGERNIGFALDVLSDWNAVHQTGETAKKAALLALKYYQRLVSEDVVFDSKGDFATQLFKTILSGTQEITDELRVILNQTVENRWKNHGDPFCGFAQFILTRFLEPIQIIRFLPQEVIRLADLFWTLEYDPEEQRYGLSIEELEYSFAINEPIMEYYPSSAYQTPVYFLLKHAFDSTIDFIVQFVNRSVSSFAQSRIGINEVEQITVYSRSGNEITQFICPRLWGIYRGCMPTTHILESIHMALEKHLLETGATEDSQTLENRLIYLLENSQSASITAIVASVVQAFPEKLFNVAEILFRTKEFFFYDLSRVVAEQSVEMVYNMRSNTDYINKIRENERIETCEERHRKISLENLAFNYQKFITEGTDKSVAEERQKRLWDLFDSYYEELGSSDNDTGNDKLWRLSLARMDCRKMQFEIEKRDDGVLIKSTPQWDESLKNTVKIPSRKVRRFSVTQICIYGRLINWKIIWNIKNMISMNPTRLKH